MRVLGVLVAWGVLAVLATLCFAVGGSIGYRRGVHDAVRQVRERRNSKAACRPLPYVHHRRRPVARMRLGGDARRGAGGRAVATHGASSRGIAGLRLSPVAVGAVVVVCLMVAPGVAVGATTARPGDTLWPVKRRIEAVRLAMATSPSRRVAVHVDLAAHRLTELNTLLSADDPDPDVVDVVIDGLRDHTEAANVTIRDVPIAEGPALAGRVDKAVARQVAVLDLLLGVDCGQSLNAQCVALSDTRTASAELQRAASSIAMAGSPTDASDPPAGPVADPTQLSGSPAALASPAPSDAASGGLPVAASSAPPDGQPSASPSPSPSATPTDGTAADDGVDGSSPVGAPSDPAGPATAAGSAEPPDGRDAATPSGGASDAAAAAANAVSDVVDGVRGRP